MLQEYTKMMELQDKKRADEWNQRESRIQSLMNKMADTVVKRNNEVEREIEGRVMRYQLDKEEKDRLEEQRRKDLMRKRHQEIKDKLDIQMMEKKRQREQENYVNDDYMKKWIDISEKDAHERKQKELENRQKQKEVQDFLLKQMGQDEGLAKDGVLSVASYLKKRGKNATQMNVEELKLNKQLLKEISKRKKEKMASAGGLPAVTELAFSELGATEHNQF